MMASLTLLIVRFAVVIPISLSASPSRLRNEKLEDGLHHFGGLFPLSSMKLSLDVMLSRHLTLVHKYSAFWFAGAGLENQFSNLHLLTAPGLCTPSISDDELQQVMCQASQPAQMAALSPPRPFAAWRVEALLSRFPSVVGYPVCDLSDPRRFDQSGFSPSRDDANDR